MEYEHDQALLHVFDLELADALAVESQMDVRLAQCQDRTLRVF